MQEIAYIIECMGESVSDRIKRRREETGLSQADFAHIASIPQRSYVDYENGVRAIPHDRLIRIARKLECDLSDLDPDAKSPATETVTMADLARGLKTIEERLPDAEALSEIRRLSAENERLRQKEVELKKIIHAIDEPRVYESWKGAEDLARVLALFYLTGDTGVLEGLGEAVQKKMAKDYQRFGLKRRASRSRA